MPRVLKIHPDDSVAVALEPLAKGTDIPAFGLTLLDDVPQAHKFALRDIAEGERVLKYGAVIGLAREAIARGTHVHVHNLKTALGDILDYSYAGHVAAQPQSGGPVPTIRVFERANGDIGIRNDLWIVPLVGCINGLAVNIAKAVEKEGMLPEGSKVTVLSHPYGCSQLGDDLANTRSELHCFLHLSGSEV